MCVTEKSYTPEQSWPEQTFNTPSIKKVCSQFVEVVSIPRSKLYTH